MTQTIKICEECGSTNRVSRHKPDDGSRIRLLCPRCHGKQKKFKDSRFGNAVLRISPETNLVYIPHELTKSLGYYWAIYHNGVRPCAIILPHKLPLEDVKHSLENILKDIELRMERTEISSEVK